MDPPWYHGPGNIGLAFSTEDVGSFVLLSLRRAVNSPDMVPSRMVVRMEDWKM